MDIEPRKTPRQARAAATVDAILQATTRILEDEGLATLNTNHIAERAGVSVGSLYQYFPTKEAILAEIIRRKRSNLLAGIDHALADADRTPLETSLERLVDLVIDSHIGWPNVARILEMAESLLPLDGETATLKRAIGARIGGLLVAHGIADADVAARDLIAIVRAMIDAAALAGDTDRDALSMRIRRAARGYLRESSETRPG